MKVPFSVNRLIDTELQFAKRFTGVLTKSYGLIYFNEANKESHDSNHAIITDFVGVEAALKDIAFFYKSRGITPRIYASLKDNELSQLLPHLQKQGFIVDMTNNSYFLHETESIIQPVHGVYFDRLMQVRTDITELVLQNGFGDWAVKVLERHLRHPGYHLLGGFYDEELVTIASLNVFEGYTRVDDVLTHVFYRGRGYSSALINHLVKYHKDISENHLYLYSAVPEAIKVYERAGFVKLPHNLVTWQAYKPL